MATVIGFKRGDTFAFTANITDNNGDAVTGKEGNLRCQVRDKCDRLFATLTATETGTSGRYIFRTSESTSSWELKTLFMDIRYTSDDGIITSSETIEINVVKDVSHE